MVKGNEGGRPRTGAFEVVVGPERKLIWSKLGAQYSFPPAGKLVELLKKEGW